jgi:hypothetical protein
VTGGGYCVPIVSSRKYKGETLMSPQIPAMANTRLANVTALPPYVVVALRVFDLDFVDRARDIVHGNRSAVSLANAADLDDGT